MGRRWCAERCIDSCITAGRASSSSVPWTVHTPLPLVVMSRRAPQPAPRDGDTATVLVKTDVVIIAGADGSTERAHRGVLATYSSVFRNALAPDLPGKALAGEAKHDEQGLFQLPLPNKSRREVSLLLAFLYPCNSRDELFNNGNIVTSIDLAEEYDMPLMKAASERWLLNELHHGRVVNMKMQANSMRESQAALAVQLLERAHTCNLHTFLAEAIDHLAYASKAEVLELLDAPGAATLPAPVLHELLKARLYVYVS